MMERGQTSVDFAIAMGVFLIALTTVIAFMPTMTQPFTGGQENPLVADRLVAQLVDGQLGDPSSPSSLNTTCTMYFFNGSAGDPCPSFDGEDDLNTKLGLGQNTFVNVSLQKNVTGTVAPETVCAEEPGATALHDPADADCESGDTVMHLGPEPPEASGSIINARRFVRFEGNRVFVVVKVWT
jgi:hypothetical protein